MDSMQAYRVASGLIQALERELTGLGKQNLDIVEWEAFKKILSRKLIEEGPKQVEHSLKSLLKQYMVTVPYLEVELNEGDQILVPLGTELAFAELGEKTESLRGYTLPVKFYLPRRRTPRMASFSVESKGIEEHALNAKPALIRYKSPVDGVVTVLKLLGEFESSARIAVTKHPSVVNQLSKVEHEA